MSYMKNIKLGEAKIKDQSFSLARNECFGILGSKVDDSFSLQVSYKDPKKSNGFINDSFYIRNKEEAWAVLALLTELFLKT